MLDLESRVRWLEDQDKYTRIIEDMVYILDSRTSNLEDAVIELREKMEANGYV